MKFITIAVLLAVSLAVTGCLKTDSQVASKNISKAAEMFEINRRIVFYNGITGEYMLVLEGRCSIEADAPDNQLEVTCKAGPDKLKKHFLGLSDNVTYFVEQIGYADVSVYHYRVIFKPQSVVPNVDFEGSSDAMVEDMTK